jgi:hypothetical protein
MLVQVPVIGKIGSPITSFFSDFGKLEGVISDTANGAFLLELEMTQPMREKLASRLTWLEKKLKDPRVSDLRKNARIIPPNPHSTLILADGTTHSCFIIDMSIAGAAVSAEVQPPVGMPLAIWSLYRPRRQTLAQRLCSQIRRKAKPQPSQPADHAPFPTAAFGRPCKGGAVFE